MNSASSAPDPVRAYWAAAEAREWNRFAELLSDGVVYELY
jgi:hypothetical protein